jgi:hypothetical protein
MLKHAIRSFAWFLSGEHAYHTHLFNALLSDFMKFWSLSCASFHCVGVSCSWWNMFVRLAGCEVLTFYEHHFEVLEV